MDTVDITIESWMKWPAVTSRSHLYLIKDNKIIGLVRKVSGIYISNTSMYEYISIQPDDDATREFFKDHPGWVDGYLYKAHYSGIDGRFIDFDDVDLSAYTDTRVVDMFEFDFGICHPIFSKLEGFGSRLRSNGDEDRRQGEEYYSEPSSNLRLYNLDPTYNEIGPDDCV